VTIGKRIYETVQAYSLLYGCRVSVLLFPFHKIADHIPRQHKGLMKGKPGMCKIVHKDAYSNVPFLTQHCVAGSSHEYVKMTLWH
jgi:hypothetical protein